jgi:hypothetical protein
MSTYPLTRLTLWALLGVALTACSDNPTGPSNATPDISALLSEMTAPSLGSAVRSLSPTAGIAMTASPSLDPRNCQYSATTGFFVCPDVVTNGLTITRMFRLIDATGNSQLKPDAQTAAIEMVNTVKGTTTPGQGLRSGALTINDSSDMTLSGVRTDQHTLNGFSRMSLSGAQDIEGITIPVNSTMTETTTNVVLPNVRAGQKWPQSGTITIDDSSDLSSFGSTEPVTTRMIVTFNGTSIVTVTFVDPQGPPVTCRFDLAAPVAGVGGACS